jgi:acyl carrier protein phosphodiesterase
MNWLAHLYLSKPSDEYRLGNLLPDFARPSEYRHLQPEILAGVACHNLIDSFTDSHPVFRQSVNRLSPQYRRFGGIVIDVFYDHLLTAEWDRLVATPLNEYTARVQDGLATFYPLLPPEVASRFAQVREAGILDSYQSLDGVELALSRINHRLRGDVGLAAAVEDLRRHYKSLREDYASFFPELRERVAQFQESQTQAVPTVLKS